MPNSRYAQEVLLKLACLDLSRLLRICLRAPIAIFFDVNAFVRYFLFSRGVQGEMIENPTRYIPDHYARVALSSYRATSKKRPIFLVCEHANSTTPQCLV